MLTRLARDLGFFLVLYWLRRRMGAEEYAMIRALVIQMAGDYGEVKRTGHEKRDFIELSVARSFPDLKRRDVDLAIQIALEKLQPGDE